MNLDSHVGNVFLENQFWTDLRYILDLRTDWVNGTVRRFLSARWQYLIHETEEVYMVA